MGWWVGRLGIVGGCLAREGRPIFGQVGQAELVRGLGIVGERPGATSKDQAGCHEKGRDAAKPEVHHGPPDPARFLLMPSRLRTAAR